MLAKYFMIIMALVALPVYLYADTGALSGKVISENTGQPIPGVTVFLEGTTFGAITDVDGAFRFENVPVGEYNIRVEFIGFESSVIENIQVNAGDNEPLSIPLMESIPGDDVEVTVPIEKKEQDQKPHEIKIVDPPIEPIEVIEEPVLEPVEVIEEPVDEVVEIDMNLSQYGTIVFNVPDTLELDQTVVIHLALSPTVPLQDIERHVTEEGALKNRRIRISKIMTADLKGTGFEIIPITESMQAINMEDITDWRWEVTAMKPGTRHLHLTVNTVVEIDGQERTRTIHSHSELITIHVSMQQRISGFVAGNWKWLWSAILVPLAGWVWENRKRRKINA